MIVLIVVVGCRGGGPRASEAVAQPAIEIVGLSPSAGSPVDTTTVIEVELAYSVEDVESYPGPYTVDLLFLTESGSGALPATSDERARNAPLVDELISPEGRITMTYPLASVIGLSGLAVPLTAQFSVSDHSDRLRARSIALTTVEFDAQPPRN